METSPFAALAAALVVGVLLGVALGWLGAGARRSPGTDALVVGAADRAVLKDGLDRLHAQVRALEEHGVSWQAQLHQQVADVRHTTDLLRRETGALATALRRPQVRGRWGELHLRRAVELAGMVDRCDFDEQVTVRADGAALRPDLVVNLTGGKQVVVDSKVPLDAFLDVAESEDDDERAAHLARHARQFRQHVDVLSGKAYWRSLDHSPEFVVMFVPGESFLSAALESDTSLIEYAAERRVVLATPTTLIALLRTVAYAWTQEALAEKAHEIHRLGVDLHGRIATMSGHLDKVGRALSGAVTSYNQAVGSWESRVLVSARRFAELDVTEEELAAPRGVEVAARTPTPEELVEDSRSGAVLPVLSGPIPLGVADEDSA